MNFSCRIAAVAGLSCAIAGFAPASAAAETDRSDSLWSHWYIGSGIGPGFGAKYKLNGQSITFDDRLQGATDKTSPIALNIVNAGIALSPNLLFGFSGSAVSQTGKLAGNDAHLQINNYFAALTWFPAEKGFFVRGGAGLSNILIDTGVSSSDFWLERDTRCRSPGTTTSPSPPTTAASPTADRAPSPTIRSSAARTWGTCTGAEPEPKDFR